MMINGGLLHKVVPFFNSSTRFYWFPCNRACCSCGRKLPIKSTWRTLQQRSSVVLYNCTTGSGTIAYTFGLVNKTKWKDAFFWWIQMFVWYSNLGRLRTVFLLLMCWKISGANGDRIFYQVPQPYYTRDHWFIVSHSSCSCPLPYGMEEVFDLDSCRFCNPPTCFNTARSIPALPHLAAIGNTFLLLG